MGGQQYYSIPTMESTPNKYVNIAAIDLGSNSFRLLIARVNHGHINVLLNRLETVRLGKGLSASGEIPPEAIKRGLAVLASFKHDIARHNVKTCRCCGTQALRQASNSPVFLDRATALLGMQIEVIDGHEEALLSCQGVLAGLDQNIRPPLLMIDVGGGSTEIAYLETPSAPPQTTSVPLGAVICSEVSGTNQARILCNSLVSALDDFLEATGINPGATRAHPISSHL